ncbi:hypothetical protein HOK00_02615 [bacterium]|jgi:hypothetical protein|nr:hypothetical protein [bacterium]
MNENKRSTTGRVSFLGSYLCGILSQNFNNNNVYSLDNYFRNSSVIYVENII